jgi:DNA-binding NarL/FixJ family response regulator
MRIVLVGLPGERARVRAQFDDDLHFEIAAEFETLDEARAAGTEAEAVILANVSTPGHSSGRDEEWIDEALTPREVEVLERLAEGLPNKTIAMRLGISDQTVKFHVASLFGKLGASTRTELVRLAVRRGLISF